MALSSEDTVSVTTTLQAFFSTRANHLTFLPRSLSNMGGWDVSRHAGLPLPAHTQLRAGARSRARPWCQYDLLRLILLTLPTDGLIEYRTAGDSLRLMTLMNRRLLKLNPAAEGRAERNSEVANREGNDKQSLSHGYKDVSGMATEQVV
ncbi:hypothetical protein Bbelb_404490 [Branchiostoma belcheri]|nr:hypothetical protein Bbelb_404490 [Branchiostoma belcheri]